MNDDDIPTYYSGSYGPKNAEAHRQLMEFLRTATREERFQTLVHAGICDAQGNLLPPYRDGDDMP